MRCNLAKYSISSMYDGTNNKHCFHRNIVILVEEKQLMKRLITAQKMQE